MDGIGRGLIKPFAPSNAYTASQEAGFDFPINQHRRQAIMAILVNPLCGFLVSFCCSL
jgi:hypothetical protein